MAAMTTKESTGSDPLQLDTMLYWYPLVSKLDIPQPETYIVEIPYNILKNVPNDPLSLSRYMPQFKEIMSKLGPFPIFIRSDMSSQKFAFKSSCRLPDELSLMPHILHIVSNNIATGLHDSAIIFRKWLDLEAGFSAFNNLPITKTARVFISDGAITCIHPAWEQYQIDHWPGNHCRSTGGINPEWRSILANQNSTIKSQHPVLEKYGSMVASVLGPGKWAADFTKGYDGEWYLLDVVAGMVVVHPKDCASW